MFHTAVSGRTHALKPNPAAFDLDNLLDDAGFDGARWPNFTWVDRKTVIYNGTYQHWGVLQPGDQLEPNNLVPPESCAGSNLTMGIRPADRAPVIFDGVGGWADQNCTGQFVSVCKITRECRLHAWRVRVWGG